MREYGAYDSANVGPLNCKASDESQAFGKAVLLFSSSARVVHDTTLEVDCGNNGDAMAQEGIGDFEAFCFKHLDEVDNP